MADADAPPLTAAEAVLAAGADPAFLPLMLAHRAADLAEGIPFRLVSVRRSSGHQAELREKYERELAAWEAGGEEGPPPLPAAKPGTSKHELGFAYDRVGPRTPEEWERSSRNAERLGLESGLRYKEPDPPHIEAPESMVLLRTSIVLRVAALAAAAAVAIAALDA